MMIQVGTSGYVYNHWKRLFYPRGLPASRWLDYYARVFTTCEINATFYRLPSPEAVDGWRRGTPAGFRFAAKGSRYLTHMKRLLEPEPGLERYFERISRLGPKLSVVLWQLPPQMVRPDAPRLRNFLRALPRKKLRHAFEFRSGDWHTSEICDLLDEFGAALCEHDLVSRPPPRVTGGFRYLRFHGTTGKYSGRYGSRALGPVARSLREFEGDSFVYFNNDLGGHALHDALDLKTLLGEVSPHAAARRSREDRAPKRGPPG
jgi:uncharacterized protein YecE (DUF72 family)